MTRRKDFLDEIVAERSVVSPAFAGMVEAAYERRVALRARAAAQQGAAAREDPGRANRKEADERRDT